VSGVYPRLSAERVRGVWFRRSWRRGVDADEVRLFLARVADEMEQLGCDLAAARAESARMKVALREWQTRNARMTDSCWRGGTG
jgi:DivIVA domain-containing protein